MILPTWVINLTARVANWNWGFKNEHRGVVRDSINSPAGIFWADKIKLSRYLVFFSYPLFCGIICNVLHFYSSFDVLGYDHLASSVWGILALCSCHVLLVLSLLDVGFVIEFL